MTHSAAEAEDFVQEACLAVLKARGSWTRAYLFAAVRTRFIDAGRQTLSKPVFRPMLNGDAIDISSRPDANSAPDFSDDFSTLEQALARLKPEEREVLCLSGVFNLSARHIARHVGRSRGSILSLLSRSRKKLLRLMHSEQIEVQS